MNGTIVFTKRGDVTATYRFPVKRPIDRASGLPTSEALDARADAEWFPLPVVGVVYRVAEIENVMDRFGVHELRWSTNTARGWAGNSDPTIHSYHGWRGTTDDIAVYGLGVRRCIEAKVSGKYSKRIFIKFGPDLHPGWN